MEQKLMKAIKKVEDEFLTEVAKRYNQHLLKSLHATTGYQLYVYVKYREINPNYGDKLLMIGRAIHALDKTSFMFQEFQTMDRGRDHHSMYPRTIDFLEIVYDEYWTKVKIKQRSVKKTEKIRWTQIVNELLLRGFIFIADAKELYNGKFYVINELQDDIEMIHPREHDSEKAARTFAIRHAIGKYRIF